MYACSTCTVATMGDFSQLNNETTGTLISWPGSLESSGWFPEFLRAAGPLLLLVLGLLLSLHFMLAYKPAVDDSIWWAVYMWIIHVKSPDNSRIMLDALVYQWCWKLCLYNERISGTVPFESSGVPFGVWLKTTLCLLGCGSHLNYSTWTTRSRAYSCTFLHCTVVCSVNRKFVWLMQPTCFSTGILRFVHHSVICCTISYKFIFFLFNYM